MGFPLIVNELQYMLIFKALQHNRNVNIFSLSGKFDTRGLKTDKGGQSLKSERQKRGQSMDKSDVRGML
ncbi:MAG: hypothetical protein CVV44_07450 [Spirochaetae bacterium HGW-Spirochaetae-1]|jgi:hypothetical protein|nr:MAG: hypothetical protein CVV44_07450 [Spirochaetae bacterium HGW-Spirochaetae-1]